MNIPQQIKVRVALNTSFRIRKFSDLPDSDPLLFMQIPDPSIKKQKNKNKKLGFYSIVTIKEPVILEE
jgi:hypothetical protein